MAGDGDGEHDRAAAAAKEAVRKLAEEASDAEGIDGVAGVAKSAVRKLTDEASKAIDSVAKDAHQRSAASTQEIYKKFGEKQSHPCNEIAEDFVRVLTLASSDGLFTTGRDFFTCVFVPSKREDVLSRHHEKLKLRLEELEKAQAERMKKQEQQ